MNILNYAKNKYSIKKINPPKILVFGFATVTIIGALLLTHPLATTDGMGLRFIDALFTATSAICVTGLVVVDTSTHFTMFGQIVIMFLIQIGGLGLMTIASLFAIVLGKKITLKERFVLQESLNQVSIGGIVRLIRSVIFSAFLLEGIGALILCLRWSSIMGWPKAFYYGIFHAISAFNNAGFDLMGHFSSLTGYTGDVVTNLVIMGLITLGGLGFFVLVDINNKRSFQKLSLHSKMVIITSFFLIVIGAIVIFVLEFSNTLVGLGLGTKILASFFQSVTTRTAGFNTIDISSLTMITQFIMIILMFIGASPGSTGGGIKTTTFTSLLMSVRSTLKGENQEMIFGRSLHKDVIQKSIAIVFLSMCLVLFTTASLAISEQADFLTLLFEAVSAFGTVGLSMGITPSLSFMGKIMIIFTMFAGRLGPLTLVFALARSSKAKTTTIKYPEERVTIG